MIRQKDRLRKGKHENHYIQPSGADAVTYAYSQTPCIGSYDYVDSLVTQNFVPGKLSINPVTIWKGIGACTEGRFDFRWPSTADTGTYRKVVSGQFAAFRQSVTSGNTDSNLANYSRVKADAKLNSASTDVGQMLVELGETLGMLIAPFQGLKAFLKKKSKLSRPMFLRHNGDLNYGKAADSVQNAWLQYRYGIIPFICDIESIMEEFAKKVHGFNRNINSRRGTVQTEVTNKTVTQDGDNGMTWDAETEEKVEIKSTSIAYFEWTLQGIPAYLSYWGLAPNQLPGLAWEAIPYSFVVDWFFNVGDWLAAISPSAYSRITGRCTSQVITIHRKVTCTNPKCYGWFLKSQSPSVYNLTTAKLVRFVDASTSAMPAFNPNFYKLERLVDSLALLWGAFRRHS